MPLEAIVTRRLYQQVADRLRELVESGEYKVGDRLPPERELAEMLDVSRPTVREALIALEVEGRVRMRVGSGGVIFVTPQGVGGWSFTTPGMYRAKASAGGERVVAFYGD